MLVKFEQNCMVKTTRNFKLFNKTIFWQSADAILEDVSAAEIIV